MDIIKLVAGKAVRELQPRITEQEGGVDRAQESASLRSLLTDGVPVSVREKETPVTPTWGFSLYDHRVGMLYV